MKTLRTSEPFRLVHAGIIRLRVWPTTIEETQHALTRLLTEVPDTELARALVIIGRNAIRIRRGL